MAMSILRIKRLGLAPLAGASLVGVLCAISAPGALSQGTAGATNATAPLTGHVIKIQTGLRGVEDCGKKLRRASLNAMGELTRFNLLWGNPPANNKDGNILYGGALTKEQVMSQYRELPSLVFTAPSYVQRFSYPLPPRKQYLLAYTRELGKLVNIMLAYVADMDLSPGERAQAAASWIRLNKLAKDVEKRYMIEYNLVENTTDDRLKKSIRDDQKVFGAPLLAIYNDMGKMNDLLKDLSRSLKKKGVKAGNV